jgi:hypothetical protein
MCPLPGRLTERRDGRKVRNPRRAGDPETDHPSRSIRKASGPRRDGTLPRRRVWRLASRLQATARANGRELWRGGNPGRAWSGPERDPFRARAVIEALKAEAGRPYRKEGRPAENVRRAGGSRGLPPRTGETLKGEAQGRSGASRAGRSGGGGREGGSQTPDVTRGRAGRLGSYGSTAPRTCRRARKAEERKHRAGAERLCGRVRGCCDGPLKGRESAGGAPIGFGRSDVRSERTRRASKRRTGRMEPMTVLMPAGCEPSERHETPGEGARGSAR